MFCFPLTDDLMLHVFAYLFVALELNKLLIILNCWWWWCGGKAKKIIAMRDDMCISFYCYCTQGATVAVPVWYIGRKYRLPT